jgi:hypothetical protein
LALLSSSPSSSDKFAKADICDNNHQIRENLKANQIKQCYRFVLDFFVRTVDVLRQKFGVGTNRFENALRLNATEQLVKKQLAS